LIQSVTKNVHAKDTTLRLMVVITKQSFAIEPYASIK
jgi:hypothetical protein